MIKKIRSIFKAKILFLRPKKTDILIFDKMGHETLVDAIKLKKEEFSCCSTRLEDLNLFVLIKMILNGKMSYKSYLKQYIKLSNPKIVLTFIDNNLFFYLLKKDFPNIKFISVQNGFRFLNDSMLSVLNNSKIENNYYTSDYYFVFNNQMKRLMEQYINAKYIVSGSLKNNKFPMKTVDYKLNGNIGFISRFTQAIFKSLEKKNDNNVDYIVHKFSSKLLISTAEYCKKYNKKLSILTTRPAWIENEKNYYNTILKNYDFEYLLKEHELDSYHNLSKVDVLVSPSSTLGSEALGRGFKVLYFSEDQILGSNLGWPFVKNLQGPFFSNKFDYHNVEKMINYISKLPKEDWLNILDEYSDYTCAFDHDNSILKNLIRKTLHNYQ